MEAHTAFCDQALIVHPPSPGSHCVTPSRAWPILWGADSQAGTSRAGSTLAARPGPTRCPPPARLEEHTAATSWPAAKGMRATKPRGAGARSGARRLRRSRQRLRKAGFAGEELPQYRMGLCLRTY